MKVLEFFCWGIIVLIGIINVAASLSVGIFLFTVADLVAYIMLVVAAFLNLRDIKRNLNYNN